MSITSNHRLCFIADWYQEEAAIIRTFTVHFYLAENALEVYEPRTKKMFLRRTKMPELTERDFFVGSKISIFGRQFDITDYGDNTTKNALAKFRRKTFILVKDSIIQHIGAVLCAFIESNFSVNQGKMVQFTAEQLRAFLGEKNKGDVEASVLMNQLLTGPCIGFELIADNSVEKLRICHSQSKECNTDNVPAALIALFEKEDMRNGIYCSKTDDDAARALAFFFGSQTRIHATCTLKNSTLAIIKPHCIKEGNLGKIIAEITNNGFKIVALRMNLMERINCEEFYEVYRGSLSEFMPMVAQLASGVCMALELVCTDEKKDAFEEFRTFCGPMDPEIAKLLRPNTLRAKFGINKVLSGVHCTDLFDDTSIELQYLFKILE